MNDDSAPSNPLAEARTGGEVVPPGVASPPTSLMEAIWRAASDPNIDTEKMKAFLEMQERMEARQAEQTFNRQFARLSGKMPRVKKNGRVELGQGKGSYPFAKWEDMDRIIRPLLDEHGFTLSFNSAPRQADGGGLVITGTLRHEDGHQIQAQMPLPLDTGPGRNNLQATGSTLSYGKRYCAEMLLNIVREGDDDDGSKFGQELISDMQCAELSREMTEAGMAGQVIFDLLGVTGLPEIRKDQLVVARNAIAMRRKQKQK